MVETTGQKIDRILQRSVAEMMKAIEKFPQPNYVALKVAEEAGEVIKAAVHNAEGRETWENVEAEVVQMIAMGLRLLVEGDQVNGIIPPTGNTQTASKWKPIHSAPVDELVFLCREGEEKVEIGHAWVSDWMDTGTEHCARNPWPTHWQPIELPATKQKESA